MEIAIHEPTIYTLACFNELVLDYQDQVYTQAYRILGERKSAEDITQDTFLIAFRKFHTFRGGSMKAWLLRIATNLCYSELRRQKIHPLISLEPVDSSEAEVESPNWLKSPGLTPEEAAEYHDREDMIQQRIAELPLQYRVALILVDVQGLDYAQAASVIGCPVGTLKSRLARSRVRLRNELRNIF